MSGGAPNYLIPFVQYMYTVHVYIMREITRFNFREVQHMWCQHHGFPLFTFTTLETQTLGMYMYGRKEEALNLYHQTLSQGCKDITENVT